MRNTTNEDSEIVKKRCRACQYVDEKSTANGSSVLTTSRPGRCSAQPVLKRAKCDRKRRSMDDEFWEIAAGHRADGLEAEQREEARAIVAAGRARRTFADLLRAISPGEVVTVVTVDGASIAGRVLGVGADTVCVGELVDPVGAARRRVVRRHDVRLSAVVRVVRDAAR
jgi:hypothetical protein